MSADGFHNFFDLFCVVDLHAITLPQNPAALRHTRILAGFSSLVTVSAVLLVTLLVSYPEEHLFCVVDLHAITLQQNPAARRHTRILAGFLS
jgi:tryptophanyl-tRNA synthetase